MKLKGNNYLTNWKTYLIFRKKLNRPFILLLLRFKTCAFFASRITWFSEKKRHLAIFYTRYSTRNKLFVLKIGPSFLFHPVFSSTQHTLSSFLPTVIPGLYRFHRLEVCPDQIESRNWCANKSVSRHFLLSFHWTSDVLDTFVFTFISTTMVRPH